MEGSNIVRMSSVIPYKLIASLPPNPQTLKVTVLFSVSAVLKFQEYYKWNYAVLNLGDWLFSLRLIFLEICGCNSLIFIVDCGILWCGMYYSLLNHSPVAEYQCYLQSSAVLNKAARNIHVHVLCA